MDCFYTKKLGREIPEFDSDEIIRGGYVHITEYESVYHDDFSECKIKYCNLKKKLFSRGYQPIGLLLCGEYIRCLRLSDKTVHLLNSKTLEPLICGTPQAYYNDFPSSLFVVKYNNKYALYDFNGSKQLTEFVTQPFRKQWNEEINDEVVINDEIGRYYYLKQGEIKSKQLSQLA